MKNHFRLKKMMYAVALASVSVVLGLIEITWFPIPPLGSFLKLDFSEVAILVAILVLGYKDTLWVILFRTIVRRLFRGMDVGDLLGEGLAVFASLSIMFSMYLASKVLNKKRQPLMTSVPIEEEKQTIREWVVTIGFVSVILALIMFTINFFVTTPIYYSYYAMDRVHFNVFSFVAHNDIFTLSSFFITCLIAFIPFNLTKGVLVSVIYLVIKPKVMQIEI